MINSFLRILFPESCPVCKKPTTNHKVAPLCSECWLAISPYKGAKCQKCGTPLSSEASLRCRDCLEEEPAFRWVRSFGLYGGILKEAINLFKYHSIKRLSKPLSKMMFALLDSEYLTGFKINPAPLLLSCESKKRGCGVKTLHADVIIPVPLSRKRLRLREFNQSALLGKHLSDYIGAELLLNCLIRIKDTIPQVGLNARERKKNVRNAFSIINKDLIAGKSVILIDDVFTTGATIRECSKLLKKVGVGDIYVLTLAHSRGD